MYKIILMSFLAGILTLKTVTIHIHHRHLLLLLSPKADTHFIVPRRVQGWVSYDEAIKYKSAFTFFARNLVSRWPRVHSSHSWQSVIYVSRALISYTQTDAARHPSFSADTRQTHIVHLTSPTCDPYLARTGRQSRPSRRRAHSTGICQRRDVRQRSLRVTWPCLCHVTPHVNTPSNHCRRYSLRSAIETSNLLFTTLLASSAEWTVNLFCCLFRETCV